MLTYKELKPNITLLVLPDMYVQNSHSLFVRTASYKQTEVTELQEHIHMH